MAKPQKRAPKRPARGGRPKNFTPRKERVEVKEITYHGPMSVGELAEKLNRNASDIIKLLFMMGTMVTINSTLDEENIELVCMEFNVECHKEVIIEESDLEEQIQAMEEDPDKLQPRRRSSPSWVMSTMERRPCWIPSGRRM